MTFELRIGMSVQVDVRPTSTFVGVHVMDASSGMATVLRRSEPPRLDVIVSWLVVVALAVYVKDSDVPAAEENPETVPNVAPESVKNEARE